MMGVYGASLLRFFGLVLPFVVTTLSATVIVSTAPAQARDCRALQAELTSLSSGRSNRIARAISRQKKALAQARQRMKTVQCGFALFGNRNAACNSLRDTVRKMQGNLAQLQRQKRQLGAGNIQRKRARLMAALNSSQCKQARPTRTKRNQNQANAKKAGPRGSVFRTLCVRSCDGYYFPVSFSVTKDMFARDEATCQARCPGAEVSLYAHDVRTEESEDMVSVKDGTPYRDLPYAFSYRSTPVSKANACSCAAQKNFTILAGDSPREQPEHPDMAQTAAVAPNTENQVLPLARPDPAADPETQQNRAGNLDLAAMRSLMSNGIDGNKRRIRVVGPVFLPDPEGAIDLRAPAQRRVQ